MSDVGTLVDRFETLFILALLAALIGFAFGYFGQRSRFYLRAATIEFAERRWGQRTAVWLITFAVAVMGTQLAITLDALQTANVLRGTRDETLLGRCRPDGFWRNSRSWRCGSAASSPTASSTTATNVLTVDGA
jgi:hypothetical protein